VDCVQHRGLSEAVVQGYRQVRGEGVRGGVKVGHWSGGDLRLRAE
jgi:hypothetical protein